MEDPKGGMLDDDDDDDDDNDDEYDKSKPLSSFLYN